MKKRNVLLILAVFFVLFGSSAFNQTYSRYIKNVSVNVSTTSSDIICDATIDNPGTYISDDGWAYFKVIVKNYDTNNNITKLPVQYYLNVYNQEGYSATYRYLDELGYTNEFGSNIVTKNYHFEPNTQDSHVINIEVKTSSLTSENVNFIVDLICSQDKSRGE